MFKKLVLSLILAGSTLTMAQSSLRDTIESRALVDPLEGTLNFLSNEEDFFVYDDEDEEYISLTATNPNIFFTDKYKLILQGLRAEYGSLEAEIVDAMSEHEKNILRNYINPNHADYHNDDKIFQYITGELKPKYWPIFKRLYGDLEDSYPDNTLKPGFEDMSDQTKKDSMVDLFFALNMVSFMTSLPGCTKYVSEATAADRTAYSNYLYRVGFEAAIIPFDPTTLTDNMTWYDAAKRTWDHSNSHNSVVARVFNFNFKSYRVATSGLIGTYAGKDYDGNSKYNNCSRINGYINKNFNLK